MFNRFVRLDDKTPGSGLGLAIVRDIALAHRARITLADMPGGAGMRVEVRFPGLSA
jgi:two-component system sensor histidine kinase TctE